MNLLQGPLSLDNLAFQNFLPMGTMKPTDQLPLFSHPTQPRKAAPEPAEFWQAVRSLRLAGHTVYRAGISHHLVDGKRLEEKQLVRLAKCHLRES
ncbi:MAG: hypothetical protein HQL44_09830 [Alphaproteobacteria bacterium]|nr:hypothetical protein [Alphaproteobacteria bacterium]